MLLEIKVPGEAAPAGSKTADPVMKKNPAYRKGERTDVAVIERQGMILIVGNPPKLPVLDSRNGRPVVRQRHARKSTEPWMELVTYYAKMARGAAKIREPLDGCLWVDFIAYEKRPKAHYRTGANAHLLRPDAPAYPCITTTGDSGKLRRAIEDALTTAEVWADDKRVVWGLDAKDYVENIGQTEPFAAIRIGRMTAQTVEDLGLHSPDPEGQQALLAPAT